MKRVTYLATWMVGAVIAVVSYPRLRQAASPWSGIGPDQIVMLASDGCGTSRKALRLVASDPRLQALIVPVPADGPGIPAPKTCAAALDGIGRAHPHVRWLPDDLACAWLAEDVARAIDHQDVPTPSWYQGGQLVDHRDDEGEAALFDRNGWSITWSWHGLALTRHGEAPATPDAAPEYRRIEDIGLSSFRPDR